MPPDRDRRDEPGDDEAVAVYCLIASLARSTMLFGVGTNDPATFIGVPVAFVLVAAVACYVPARQARRLDPLKAINADY